ncbi:MAG: glycogen/starch synthase, partial [Rhodospirillales bacterium]|nr:glycogen/starch synthase [Rhodospirillales bacterium]
MKVLFVTSEFSGLAKAGGLGEVSAGLPLALRLRGIDVRVLMPAYPDVIAKLPDITWFGRLAGRAAIPGCRIGTAVPNAAAARARMTSQYRGSSSSSRAFCPAGSAATRVV